MEPAQEADGQRLALAATLMGLARRCCGRRISAASTSEDLLRLARDLQHGSEAIHRAQGYQFLPSYPGVTAGTEAVGGGLRLFLACNVRVEGRDIGVVFTTLIPGHPPRVSIAPPGALIPDAWLPLDSAE